MKTAASPLAILCASLFVSGFTLPALAAARIDTYRVEHPSYGTIGSYVHEIDTQNGMTRIELKLHVAIKALGAVLYRQDTNQQEVMRGKTLLSLSSITNINGTRTDVHGEVLDGRFLLTSPSGTTEAPADILPFDLWSLNRTGACSAIKAGKVDDIRVSGGATETLAIGRDVMAVRHFHIESQTEPGNWDVWIDNQDTPVKFQFLHDGEPIAFILSGSSERLAENP